MREEGRGCVGEGVGKIRESGFRILCFYVLFFWVVRV